MFENFLKETSGWQHGEKYNQKPMDGKTEPLT